MEHDAAARERAAQLPKGLKGLRFRFTGQHQQLRAQLEAEAARERQRHQQERQRVLESQREERAVLGAQFKELRKSQAEQLLELRKDVGRYLQWARSTRNISSRRSATRGLELDR